MGMTALVGAMMASTVYTMSQSKSPSLTSPTAATTPQDAKTPTAQSVQSGMQNSMGQGGGPAASSTLLTGPGGVSPNSLNLQQNTLLGS